MGQLTRRNILKGMAAVGVTAPGAYSLSSRFAGISRPGDGTGGPTDTTLPGKVVPGDSRYPELVVGDNNRFVGIPDYVQLVTSTDQVARAVQEAVSAGKHVAVRSGGHCYLDWTTNSGVKAVIDLSELTSVTFDTTYGAFSVEAGTTVGQMYDVLFKNWGVTLPGGSCPSVGAGGHICGGGYGALNRSLGLTVDHLYGVEVVVVDGTGIARSVTATRDATDPALQDLWWAHTGGGGGNFGVVTRYLLKTPGVASADPGSLLPKAPSQVWVARVTWPWSGLTQAGFHQLLKNFGGWCAANSAPDSPYTALFSRFFVTHPATGDPFLGVQVDASVPDAEQLLSNFISAVSTGVSTPAVINERELMPWLRATHWAAFFPGDDGTNRGDFKSAYMRTNFPDEQIAALYEHLISSDFSEPAAMVQIATYGGKTNTVPSSATAVPQRDSVMKMMYLVDWPNAVDDDAHIAWIREIYQATYAATGGVPVPNEITDGCYVNYPDIDLSDPEWNKSGVPWSFLYYKNNYARLKQAKERWDPLNIFNHSQSVELG